MADRFEQNDTPATASSLSTVAGLLSETSLSIEANDPDWYRFTLTSPGRTGDFFRVSFNNAIGDLDLYLYASNGTTLLDSSYTVNDVEEIELAGLAAGTYLALVEGWEGDSNPNYTLTLSVAPGVVAGDRFEQNDTAVSATDLHTLSGNRTEANLSIESGDPDWYRFTLAAPGRVGDTFGVSFNHASGDLDLRLYAIDGTTVLDSSTGVGNAEEVELAGLATGTYLAQVYGWNGASNPNYTLNLTFAPTVAAGDRFEQNDTAATATALTIAGSTLTEANLSIEAGDPDWYRFTLAAPGRLGDTLGVSFNHALGDLDLRLYASDGTTLLDSSTGVGNAEEIDLAGLAAGTYLAQVYGWNGASNPSYTLNLAVAPGTAAGDRFEQNDTAATATDLRTISGSLSEANLSIEAGDPDWYRFALAAPGRVGDTFGVSFNHALGDVDLRLYASDGSTLIDSSAGVGNVEEIDLAGLAAGTYIVQVYGWNGASNPGYTLNVSVAPGAAQGDRFEQNDTAATATDLRTISGNLSEDNLSIEAGDPDWYRFTLAAAARVGDALGVTFNHALGDLDLRLYASDGTTVISSSTGVGNGEQIDLAGLAAGTYLAQVYGWNGASNPSYTLNLSVVPGATSGDRFEQNDTAATATDLRTISGNLTESNLSVESNDPDWYRFTLGASGRAGDSLGIGFNNALGDLDLRLYASDGTTVLASSTGVGDGEQISLDGIAAGTYLAQVYGYSGVSNPAYSLSISVSQTSGLGPDQWEDNDTRTQPTEIRNTSAEFVGATITAGDEDWFRFNLPTTGVASDYLNITHATPGLKLQLWRDNTIVGNLSADATGGGSLSLSGLAAGTYLARVAGETATVTSGYDLAVRAAGGTPAPTGNTWSMLVFVNGDNNLESFSLADINEMEAATLDPRIRVAVQADRIAGYSTSDGNWTDTRRGIIVHDTSTQTIGSTLQSLGERDMGSGATLTEFLNWAAVNAPAEHYALVIWDHGAGALGGSSYDDTQGSNLSNREVAQAIAASTLRSVDILGFDACLMGAVEIGFEVAPVAARLVGAERTEPGDGWDYTTLLNRFSTSPALDASALTTAIVDAYQAFYRGADPLASIRTDGLRAIGTAIDGFVATMTSASATDWSAVATARGRATTGDAGYEIYTDIVSFMSELKTASANAAIDSAAQTVINAVSAAVERTAGPADLHGLTVVFPATGESAPASYNATNQKFLADTRWDEFVSLFQTRSAGAARSVSGATPDSATTRAATAPDTDFAETLDLAGRVRGFGNNDTPATALDFGAINQRDYRVAGLSIDAADDVDAFRFTLPAGATFSPSVSVILRNASQDVSVKISGAETTVFQGDSSGGVLPLVGLTAGASYLLEVRGKGGATVTSYDVLVDAFGGATPATMLRDLGEAGGGNDSREKAFLLGDSERLSSVGRVGNLSIDATDVVNRESGGDWFQVPPLRVLEANANRVTISGISDSGVTLGLRVYTESGDLLAQSQGRGDNRTVWFDPRPEPIWVQVAAVEGQTVRSYALAVGSAATQPALEIAAVSTGTIEGDSGTSTQTFSISRVGDANHAVSVDWRVEAGTAVASDFSGGVLPSGTATLAPGETSVQIPVRIAGDGAIEPDETFTVTLSNPAGATLAVASTSGSIVNDDGIAAGRTVSGTEGSDPALLGGAGHDTISGLAGNDTLTGGGGNDRLDGGADADTATFSGALSGYALSRTGATITITDLTAGRDGTDTGTNLERLQFSDMGVNLTVQATAASIASSALDRICELYVGFFGRVPAANGLENWINQFKGGRTLDQISDDFYGIGSSLALRQYTGYWDFTANRALSDQDFVEIVYRNVLGREGLQQGIDYWAGQLIGVGAKSRGALVSTMLDAAHGLKTNADWGWVANLLDDRIEMSKRVAMDWGLNYASTDQQAIEKGMAIAGAYDESANPNPALSSFLVKTFDFDDATLLVGVNPANIDL